MANPVQKFIDSWVSENVHNVPGLSEASDLKREVARLKAEIIADGAARGISAAALESTMGGFEDYLQHEYENVHDPELGFKRT